ncbi:MAG: DUF4382 domain-containing protein [Deltaproteobacteria bacterium]|nr:DUF4382 domain-containing protein [Deltaproteobacteria bacterium]
MGDDEDKIIVMDFDVRKSVHEQGNGQYNMNPVVRIFEADAVGTISGETDPAVPRAVVYAFPADTFGGDNFDDAANSAIVRDDGSFTLAGLPPGSYDIVVAADGYETAVYVEDVEVEAGFDTALEDPIALTPEG